MNQITIVKAPRRPDLLALRAACDPRAVFCSGLLYTAVTGTYQVFFFIEPFLLCCKTLFLLIGRLMTVQCIRYCYILFILFLDVDLQSRCCHVWISLKKFFFPFCLLYCKEVPTIFFYSTFMCVLLFTFYLSLIICIPHGDYLYHISKTPIWEYFGGFKNHQLWNKKSTTGLRIFSNLQAGFWYILVKKKKITNWLEKFFSSPRSV